MGQKTHPRGFRLGIVAPWRSRWYAEKDFPKLLVEDEKIRKYLGQRLGHASISEIQIERKPGKTIVTVHTARPGVVIGKKGAEVDKLFSQNADAIIGAAASGVSVSVIDKITGAGVVHFSPANTAAGFDTYEDNGLYFRTAPSDVLQGQVLGNLAVEDGYENVAVLATAEYVTGHPDTALRLADNTPALLKLQLSPDSIAVSFFPAPTHALLPAHHVDRDGNVLS